MIHFAVSDALEKAISEAGPVLLEPIMKLEVVTPEDYFGNITADLSSRRSEITHTYDRGKLRVIEARAPWRKCSATPPPSGRFRKGERRIRWNRWNRLPAGEHAGDRGGDVKRNES